MADRIPPSPSGKKGKRKSSTSTPSGKKNERKSSASTPSAITVEHISSIPIPTGKTVVRIRRYSNPDRMREEIRKHLIGEVTKERVRNLVLVQQIVDELAASSLKPGGSAATSSASTATSGPSAATSSAYTATSDASSARSSASSATSGSIAATTDVCKATFGASAATSSASAATSGSFCTRSNASPERSGDYAAAESKPVSPGKFNRDWILDWERKVELYHDIVRMRLIKEFKGMWPSIYPEQYFCTCFPEEFRRLKKKLYRRDTLIEILENDYNAKDAEELKKLNFILGDDIYYLALNFRLLKFYLDLNRTPIHEKVENFLWELDHQSKSFQDNALQEHLSILELSNEIKAAIGGTENDGGTEKQVGEAVQNTECTKGDCANDPNLD